MIPRTSPLLVKISEHGLLTISMPEMAGRYMVLEQRDGQLVITPYNLESAPPMGTIVQQGGHWALLGAHTGEMPQA